MLKELLETPVTGDLPAEHLRRLPEWCVYVELDGPEPLGFYAHLEYDLNNHECELMLVLDYPDGFVPVAARLRGTLEQAVSEYVTHAKCTTRARGTTRAPREPARDCSDGRADGFDSFVSVRRRRRDAADPRP